MPASPHHHTLPLISTDSPVIAQDDPVSLRDTRGELQRVMQELDGILNTAVMGIALLRHRQIDRCNSRMEELFGYGKGEMLGQSTRVWYPDENVWTSVGDDVYGALAAGREAFRELEFQRRDGSRFWGRLAGRALDPADPYAASVWIIDDLTRERAEREELSLARRVFEVNSEAIMVSDRHNRIVQVNAAFERITGFRREEVIGHDPKILGSGRHDKAFFTAMWETLTAHGHWAGELWDRHRDGREYPKWAHIDTIRDADGAISHYVTVFADISERKAAEERIRFLAQHDALTGLPNRPTLTAHLDHALARARRNGDGVAVMFIDLDNFKGINDTLGHAVGDLLLCSAAHRISDTLRHSDILARIGGDEFVVVLENISDPADVSHVGQKILDRFADALIIEGRPLHTTPSIGISLFPDDGEDIDALMKNADVAMYHAKSAGRNNFQFFAEHMNRATAVRAEMESRLRHALNHGELHLNFQPQITLANGNAHGMEALLRWRNAELGMVSPAVFIPLAEEIGLIVVIGEWVLRTACETARRWLDEGIPFGHLSVNISPHQFRQANFPDRLAAILRSTGLPGERLELEITESTLMETAEISINMLQRLKALGVALAVDDFGTGYSSLAYLKRFPIDRLKIDRAFIADLETDASDATIASAVIALAHSLGLEVVAEGVETPGQTAFLRTHGCDSVQGFLFSRPLPEEAARAFFLDPPALTPDCLPVN